MNIININSDICLNDNQISFIRDILINGDDGYIRYRRNSLFRLIKSIPIFLLDENSFEKEIRRLKIEVIKGEFPSTEYLGFYTREKRSFFDETPVIVLCLERIYKLTRDETKFLYLTTLTVIHEFMHAILDIDNVNKFYKKDEFFEWMEESMANAMALELIKHYFRYLRRTQEENNCQFILKDDLLIFAKNFVKHQPPHYALGYEIYKNYRWYIRWGRYKKKLAKLKTKEKQSWLNYVKQNYNSIDRNTLYNLYEALFADL